MTIYCVSPNYCSKSLNPMHPILTMYSKYETVFNHSDDDFVQIDPYESIRIYLDQSKTTYAFYPRHAFISCAEYRSLVINELIRDKR